MTCCRDAAANAVDALERIDATGDLWSTLTSVANGYGFDHIIAYRIDVEAARPHVVRATVPAEFVAALERQGFPELVENLVRAGRPILVSAQHTQLTSEQRRLIDHGRQTFDVRGVLLLPIRTKGDLSGIVALAGSRAAVPPIVRSSLHLLAHIAFLGAEAKIVRKSTLSPREAECLRLASQGNTDTAIGRLLSISPRTARFHIENAKKKLGVTTRTQAVAEALRLNAFAA